MKSYIFALVSPLGRLPLSAYWIMVAPLIVALLGFRFYLQTTNDVGDSWYLLLIVLLWMHFSLLCRRLQDNNMPGMLLIPLFACLFFVLIMELDPLIIGIDPHDVADWDTVLHCCTLASGLLGCAWIYGVLIAGDVDITAYGPPLGETSETVRQKKTDRIRDRVKAQYGGQAAHDHSGRTAAPIRDETVYEVRGGLVKERHVLKTRR